MFGAAYDQISGCLPLQNGSTSALSAATIDLAPDNLPGAASRGGAYRAASAEGSSASMPSPGNGDGAGQQAAPHAEDSPLEAVLKPAEEAAEAIADKVLRRRPRSCRSTALFVSVRDALVLEQRALGKLV